MTGRKSTLLYTEEPLRVTSKREKKKQIFFALVHHVLLSLILQASSGNLYIQLLDGGVRASEHDLDTLFHRMNNAFVRRLSLSFHADDAVFLYYLRANADGLQCQVGALRVLVSSAEIDHVLVEFVGVHLKPRVYEACTRAELPQDYAMLFTRNVLRGNIAHLVYEVRKSAFRGGTNFTEAELCLIFSTERFFMRF